VTGFVFEKIAQKVAQPSFVKINTRLIALKKVTKMFEQLG
jgi:hypothetical protein